jgi:hypothetical protein
MKLQGKVDDNLFTEACKAYLNENYRKTIAPLLQIRGVGAKKQYTHDSAITHELGRLKKMYLK